MTTTSEADQLRQEIRVLTLAVGRGDLSERSFNVKYAACAVNLYRAVIAARLARQEQILHEHHVVRTHLKLNQSILRETTQEAISFFLTDRRLFRLRHHFTPAQAITADDQDGTVVDEIQLRDIKTIRVRRQVRWGEALTGAVIVVAAVLFREWLLITGTLMIALGTLGALHGILRPAQWFEIVSERGLGQSRMEILAARKKSARRLVNRLRERRAAATAPRGTDNAGLFIPPGMDHDRE